MLEGMKKRWRNFPTFKTYFFALFSDFDILIYAIDNGRVLDPDTLVELFSQLSDDQKNIIAQAGFNINYEVLIRDTNPHYLSLSLSLCISILPLSYSFLSLISPFLVISLHQSLQ